MILFLLGAHNELIYSPPFAVFPHPLASDLNFGRFVTHTNQRYLYRYVQFLTFFKTMIRYWNYLRKQTFVLESYVTRTNWIMNRVLFVAHCYLSWGFVAPYFMAVIHIVAVLRFFGKGYSYDEMLYGDHSTFPSYTLTHSYLSLFNNWY